MAPFGPLTEYGEETDLRFPYWRRQYNLLPFYSFSFTASTTGTDQMRFFLLFLEQNVTYWTFFPSIAIM